MLRGWWVGVGRSWFVREGLGLVGWGWSVLLWAFRIGVGGLGLVGRSLRWRIWGWWVEVGPWWVVLLGLGWVGWGWLVVGCAGTPAGGYGGLSCLRLVGLCMRFWGWWVGVGQWWFVLSGLGLVGWGWSVVACACRYGMAGTPLEAMLAYRVCGWWVCA